MTTVTEAAIIDLERQREAFMARAKNFDPVLAGVNAREIVESGETSLSAEMVEALCRPVRIEITFEDPIKTRKQIEHLMAELTSALVVTQDHGRGISRQRMDLRHIIKTAAEHLVYMSGRTPTGRKKLTPKTF